MISSLKFPNILNSTSTNVITDHHEATFQNLRLLLLSHEGSLFGDPYFGVNFAKDIMFEPNDDIALDLLKDSVYTKVAEFMPQIHISRDDILRQILFFHHRCNKLITNLA